MLYKILSVLLILKLIINIFIECMCRDIIFIFINKDRFWNYYIVWLLFIGIREW